MAIVLLHFNVLIFLSYYFADCLMYSDLWTLKCSYFVEMCHGNIGIASQLTNQLFTDTPHLNFDPHIQFAWHAILEHSNVNLPALKEINYSRNKKQQLTKTSEKHSLRKKKWNRWRKCARNRTIAPQYSTSLNYSNKPQWKHTQLLLFFLHI